MGEPRLLEATLSCPRTRAKNFLSLLELPKEGRPKRLKFFHRLSKCTIDTEHPA